MPELADAFDGDADALRRLEAWGVVRRGDDGRARATDRFRAAVTRAAIALLRSGDEGDDLRVPLVAALFEIVPELRDDETPALVHALLPIARLELTGRCD